MSTEVCAHHHHKQASLRAMMRLKPVSEHWQTLAWVKSHTKQPPDLPESYNPGYKNTANFAWPTSNTVVMPYRPIHTFVILGTHDFSSSSSSTSSSSFSQHCSAQLKGLNSLIFTPNILTGLEMYNITKQLFNSPSTTPLSSAYSSTE